MVIADPKAGEPVFRLELLGHLAMALGVPGAMDNAPRWSRSRTTGGDGR